MENIPPTVQNIPETQPEQSTPKHSYRIATYLVTTLVIGAAISAWAFVQRNHTQTPSPISQVDNLSSGTDSAIPFQKTDVRISKDVSADFSMSEIQNLDIMQKKYGVTFSKDDLDTLSKNKFVIKNLLDTNLPPVHVGENGREFVSLYSSITGDSDYKERTHANAMFISSDVLMNLFSILSVDLLKETENKYLFPQVLTTTETLYNEAAKNLNAAKTDEEKNTWMKVRNYFAIPLALLSTKQTPLSADEYWNSDHSVSLEDMQAQFAEKDTTADSIENTTKFIKNLHLDKDSESRILSDLTLIYEAPAKELPNIFKEEFVAVPENIRFVVPFSLFKVRGSYTSSSYRRQYFRAVQWYQQIPFFTNSKQLTTYAVAIGHLTHNNPTLIQKYDEMSSLLGALIGNSDDLDVRDYAHAVEKLGSNVNDTQALTAFLDTQKPQAKIKSMPAFYDSVGEVTIDQVMNSSRGMRFFSQKFIPDSYWTGKLTQGDEQPAVNGKKLPRSVSSLEVMSILGSEFAYSQLPKLPFYAPHKDAIDTRLSELTTEAKSWGDNYWRSNQVTSILWTISGLFDWQQKNRSLAPQFMQSPLWDIKTLVTGSAFWTELRHTNILYAKQSFAEKGGGGDSDCDIRKIPPPAIGYVEPQPDSYDRLFYTAQLLDDAYKTRKIELKNLKNLEEYISLVDIVREYSKLELENTKFDEPTISKTVTTEDGKPCTQNFISPTASVIRGDEELAYNADSKWVAAISRPEELRLGIVARMNLILPAPVEGPVISMKDKRTAVVADIHTSDEGIIEEGTGVPRVVFVAVKDANGPRLTIGFTYSHYEQTSDTRLTDEDWQKNFYTDEGGDYMITYTPKSAWPTFPLWYQPLLGTK